jgi:hypothetical protein
VPEDLHELSGIELGRRHKGATLFNVHTCIGFRTARRDIQYQERGLALAEPGGPGTGQSCIAGTSACSPEIPRCLQPAASCLQDPACQLPEIDDDVCPLPPPEWEQ